MKSICIGDQSFLSTDPGHTMSVIPMCACRKPAKVYVLQTPLVREQSPLRHYLACRLKVGGCGMFMWCKLRDHGNPEEEDSVEVYDELVLQNTDLELEVRRLTAKLYRMKNASSSDIEYFSD
ncbi:hypothetical protein LINPERPRIM_LOCUS31687 [Linum perenne]